MMTRKHFQTIAATMLDLKPIGLSEIGQAQAWQWKESCNRLASMCAQENPRFQRDKFLAACGMIEE